MLRVFCNRGAERSWDGWWVSDASFIVQRLLLMVCRLSVCEAQALLLVRPRASRRTVSHSIPSSGKLHLGAKDVGRGPLSNSQVKRGTPGLSSGRKSLSSWARETSRRAAGIDFQIFCCSTSSTDGKRNPSGAKHKVPLPSASAYTLSSLMGTILAASAFRDWR